MSNFFDRSKVERYLSYKAIRDELPGNDDRRNHHWMRVKYEKYSFLMAMTKPTERDWAEHTFALLQKDYT